TGYTWCSGRAGADLVAAQRFRCGVSAAGRATLAAAADVPAQLAIGAPHHLCCGLVGSALTVAATTPATRPTLLTTTLDRLHREREPRYLAQLPAYLHQPGLMAGAAGVAYGLLLLTGARLPNALVITP